MALSPMMQQYHDAKQAAGDAILLFRMGDFYELFHDDAKTAARVLNLTLTSRDKSDNPIPMAGFPYHQLESYLGKLIAAGYRAAICDQVEDPKKAKGLVKRDITRIVSRGTVTDDALLEPTAANYLAAVVAGEPAGMAWVDLSTGRFLAGQFPAGRVVDELARIEAVECLVADDAEPLPAHVSERTLLTRRPPWAFSHDAARKALAAQFQSKTLDGFGFSDRDAPAIRAAGAILEYLQETQKTNLGHIERLIPYGEQQTLEIDEASRRSLELTRTIRDGAREGSLLGTMDRAVTPMGSRMLADWISNPLLEIPAINARLDAVAELVDQPRLASDLRDELKQIYDMQRLLSRVTTGRASPRDLSFVGRTLRRLPSIKAKLTERRSGLLCEIEANLDLCEEVRAALDAALIDDCPLSTRDGGFIRPGFAAQLDELRELTSGGKQWIARYQAEQSELLDIPNIKVGFNKVFGYYLEITHAHSDKVPETFIRKQTVKAAERYITPELKEYEEKVLSAEERAKDLESTLFEELRGVVAAASQRLLATAEVLAQIDTLAALAELARSRGYCRPQITDEAEIQIVDGKHPVLDILEPEGQFVPNDTTMGAEDGQILLITGPNMAGKSTYIRQVALLTLMAQAGSFIPAREARIGVADRIFARVGASDELSRGQSTFMVEMTETARILNTATSRSLVILDEIGRGTSTYDGLSLAWAIVEHLHDSIGCRTLFATHYHELTDLAGSLQRLRNFNVAVREWEEDVIFLHKIVAGAADKSYGIHVARLAGVPKDVNERAKTILAQLEDEHLDGAGRPKIARDDRRSGGDLQLTLFAPYDHPLLDKIRSLDLNETTPLDALRTIQDWQAELAGERKKTPR
ncbi:MAG: DNA mismatch repair protein MutS [Planctomycetales bacterium]|nr:DNA mismatch repair protein MutS [Planctomycetales bacterium]